MLKEKFLPGKALLSFLITIITFSIFSVVLVTLIDYIIYIIRNGTKFYYPFNKPLTVLYIYWWIVFVGIFYFFIFFLILLMEFFYRYYNLPFWGFLLMSIAISLFCAWLSWRDTYSLISIGDGRIQNTICLIIIGISYPFISNFWAIKIKFIKLVPADD